MPSRLPFKRSERVGDLAREILSEILMKRISHQGLEAITVTAVKVSDDLQHAKAFYRVLNPRQRAQVAKALAKALPAIRRELGREMKTRYTPELKFEYDESLEHGDRIEALLHSLSTSRRPSDEE